MTKFGCGLAEENPVSGVELHSAVFWYASVAAGFPVKWRSQ